MRKVMLALAIATLTAGSLGCAADATPEEDAAASQDALATLGRARTTRYAGIFTEGGRTLTVELDVTLPAAAIGYQRQDSGKWRNGSARCRVYNEWTPGTMTLRVRDRSGEILSEVTKPTGGNGFAPLDRSDCPDGVLVSPRVRPVIDMEVSVEGIGFELGGTQVHVPRGYFQPGFVFLRGTSSFRALGPASFEDQSEPGFARSKLEIERGLIGTTLPAETAISIGIGPSLQGQLGYERTVDVTLRAR